MILFRLSKNLVQYYSMYHSFARKSWGYFFTLLTFSPNVFVILIYRMCSMISRDITSCNEKSRNPFHSIQIILAIQSIIQFFYPLYEIIFFNLVQSRSNKRPLKWEYNKSGQGSQTSIMNVGGVRTSNANNCKHNLWRLSNWIRTTIEN